MPVIMPGLTQPQDEEPAIVQDEHFNEPNGNFILQATDWQTGNYRLFKIQRETVAAASPVLKRWFNMPELYSGNLTAKAPMIKMDECSKVTKVILAAAYNRVELVQSINDDNWRTIHRVWEAARRYEMPMLRSYASMALIARKDTIKSTDALMIYKNAAYIEDTMLASNFLHLASRVPHTSDGLVFVNLENASKGIHARLKERDSGLQLAIADIRNSLGAQVQNHEGCILARPGLASGLQEVQTSIHKLLADYF